MLFNFGRPHNAFLYCDMAISDIHFYTITNIKPKPFQILASNTNEWMSVPFATIVLVIYFLLSLHYCFHRALNHVQNFIHSITPVF